MSIDTTNIFLKCRFKSSNLNFYGLMMMMFDSSQKIKTHTSVVSSFSDLYNIDPNILWSDFETEINTVKWGGKFNQAFTKDISTALDNLNNDKTRAVQLFTILNNYDYGSAENYIFDLLRRIIQDKNLNLDINIQEVTPEEMQAAKDKRDAQIKEKYNGPQQDNPVNENATVLQVSPILSPVKGIPVTDLKIGNKIMVKIEPVSEKANYYIHLYKLKEDGVIRPLPAEVVDIKSYSSDGAIEIMAKIDEGVFGKCVEEEIQVKVRIFDPKEDYSIEKNNKEIKNKVALETSSDGSRFIVFLFGLAIVLLAALIGIVYMII